MRRRTWCCLEDSSARSAKFAFVVDEFVSERGACFEQCVSGLRSIDIGKGVRRAHRVELSSARRVYLSTNMIGGSGGLLNPAVPKLLASTGVAQQMLRNWSSHGSPRPTLV